MKHLFLFLFIPCIFFSCSNSQTTKSSDENKQAAKSPDESGADYTIDLDGNKEPSIPYSAIFKRVRTIILDTQKDCMMGSVDELQVFDGCIYILDESVSKSLFVFDMEGRFIRKIGRLGNGPGEYLRLSDFTIDTENRFIFLCDDVNRVHKYRLDGTYVHSITIPNPSANTFYIQYYQGVLYASVLAWEPTEDDYMLLGVDPDDGKILSRALPLKYNKGWGERRFAGHSFFMSRLNAPPRYTQLFMDDIVSLGEEPAPHIALKSKNLVTKKDLEMNAPQKGQFMNFMERLQHFQGTSKIWNVHSFVENDDFILFKYQSGFNELFTAIFNKEAGTVKIAKNLVNDLLLMHGDDSMSVMPGSLSGFKFSDTQGAYEYIHPILLGRFVESIKNNKTALNLDKLDQLMKLNRESNPVIFFYEFK